MSKCREEFRRLYGIEIDSAHSLLREGWQIAWNARGKVDAEICRKYSEPVFGGNVCANVIEQENEQ